MMQTLERAARALYARAETYPPYALSQMNEVLATDLARAVLEAIREPDEGMLVSLLGEECGLEEAGRRWQSAIDSILSEKEKT
jgi:hypothetical protein